MAHDHGHGAGATRARLAIALGVAAAILIAELVGAWLAGSLALLADAGHIATDAVGLSVALAASVVAARPATDRHTFGFQRFEVLAALVNGGVLIALAVVIVVEAIRRLVGAEGVAATGLPLAVVAAVALLGNLGSYLVLRGGDRNSLNLRGAMLEVAGDVLGAAAALVAGVVIMATGFAAADAVASLAIAVLIVPRGVLLLRDVVRVLTESAPRETSVSSIREHLLETEGVVAVHDVHVWTITSGAPVFTAHVVVEHGVLESGGAEPLLDRLGDCLRGHFDVEHSTFQLEPASHAEHEEHAHP